jgi:predicted SAM-dependent methyltransferase
MDPKVLDHLHLGCGLTAPTGWLNVDGSLQVLLARRPWLKNLMLATGLLSGKQGDIPWSADVVRLNLNRPLPFADGQFAAVYSSHVLEHLYHDQALALLKECHRILRPGAVCRAVVPDLGALVGRYVRAKAAADPNAGTRMMEELMVHDKAPGKGLFGAYYWMTAYHQHKWMYDAASLEQLFTTAGFHSVRQADCLDSRIGRVAEVELPGRILGGQGVAVEGIKD